MLKRSNYVDKYAGEWDLPGGHIRIGEDFISGMRREVKEETDLDIENTKFVKKLENLNFYYCSYNNRPIKLSHEHTGFRFFAKKDLDPKNKFEKVALKVLEMKND
jgi:8-oxo-dGTP diphosphatase